MIEPPLEPPLRLVEVDDATGTRRPYEPCRPSGVTPETEAAPCPGQSVGTCVRCRRPIGETEPVTSSPHPEPLGPIHAEGCPPITVADCLRDPMILAAPLVREYDAALRRWWPYFLREAPVFPAPYEPGDPLRPQILRRPERQ